MTHLDPTAQIEPGASIGEGTAVWSNVHVRAGAEIGAGCIIGEKTYVAGGVVVGDLCKINALAYLCAGVTLECGVMVSAGVIFTNDRYPRAATPDLDALLPSEAGTDTLPTLVREGATIGAGSVIGCGLTIGRFALVGMGSIVTRDVGDFHLVVGNPATPTAAVCRCGEPVHRFVTGRSEAVDASCTSCGRGYRIEGRAVTERP